MLDMSRVYGYFTSSFNLKKSSKGWYTFNCPYCDAGRGKKKAAVSFNYNRVKCWECGFDTKKQGGILYFVKDLEELNDRKALELLWSYEPQELELSDFSELGQKELVSLELPVGFTPLLEDGGVMGKRARNYLGNRGFDLRRLDRLGFGYCVQENEEENKNYFGYIIIPFKSKGKLIYYQGRDYIGNYLRYKNPSKDVVGLGKGDCLYNEDALYLYDTIFITEGWADAETIGSTAISTQGWNLSSRQKNLLLTSPCSSLVFVPDVDKEQPDKYYREAIATALDYVEHKQVYVLPIHELSEYGKDVNEVGKNRVLDLFTKQEPLDYFSCYQALIK